MSYRTPRFKVRLRAIFQSSLKYHPKKFLLKAAKALKVTPLPPPVPSRKEAIPTPVFGSAAVGFGPCVKFCPNEVVLSGERIAGTVRLWPGRKEFQCHRIHHLLRYAVSRKRIADKGAALLSRRERVEDRRKPSRWG